MKIKTDFAKLLTSKKCVWIVGILLFFFSIQVYLVQTTYADSENYELIMQWPSSDSALSGLEDVEKALNQIT